MLEALVLLLLQQLRLLVSFVHNNTFPQPLTEEEEAVCLRRLEQGDDAARQTLIERNLRLVAHVVKKFDNTGEDMDDLISIGTIGLIKAVNTYSSDKGTRLATYAARCVENEILMHLRSNKKNKVEVFLQEPIGIDKEGNEITLMDILPVDHDAVSEEVEAKLEKVKLLSKLADLTPRERNVLEMRYGLNGVGRRTQREIAKSLGISRSYISRIEKRAVQKLLRDLEAENWHH